MNLAQSLLADPAWYPHRLDLYSDRMLFLKLTEQAYRQSTFLDGESFVGSDEQRVAPWRELSDELNAQPTRQSVGIFHISHCGSTLLSRVLAELTGMLPLREPALLRMLAALERDRTSPLAVLEPAVADALQGAMLRLLSRTFDGAGRALLKATSDCTNLTQSYLAHNPDNRIVGMTMQVESYLATMLRSEPRREETQGFAVSRLADLHRCLGADDIRLYELAAGPLAAMSWLSSMLQLTTLAEQYPDRVLLVDFEAWLGDPLAETRRVLAFVGDAAADDAIDGCVEQALRLYSKDPTLKYGIDVRNQELAVSRQSHAAAIAEGLKWLERTVQRYAERLPRALLDGA